jgi:hypothetical protein
MFLGSKDDDLFLDFDLEFLTELLSVLDERLAALEKEGEASGDPDGLGYLDRIESVTGLGFVACQQYIHATYPFLSVATKSEALQKPPMHSSGRPVVEVINAAANYWKHHDEWRSGETKSHEERTRALIRELLPSPVDYVAANLLYELVRPAPATFGAIVPLLVEWRDGLLPDAG